MVNIIGLTPHRLTPTFILSSGIYGVRNRTWVPNTDTPVIYGIKRLNKI